MGKVREPLGAPGLRHARGALMGPGHTATPGPGDYSLAKQVTCLLPWTGCWGPVVGSPARIQLEVGKTAP